MREKKIIDYKIIDGSSHTILEANVNRLIKDGYQPHGNIYASLTGNSLFLQPMIKYDDNIERGIL
jgi:hypothetical protein